jgi:hypothetical protein
LFDRFLPNDPAKRDMVILALIVVPLMAIGFIWGIIGDFDGSGSVATPVPTIQPSPSSTPSASPAAFVIVDAA